MGENIKSIIDMWWFYF